MKVRVFVICAALMTLWVTACGSPTPAPTAAAQKGDPYKIGVVVSITGPVSSLGIPERDTALMIRDAINKAGGVKGPDGKLHELQVVVEDDGSDASKATLATKKLIEQDKVVIIIGSSGSPASLAMVDVVTPAKVPMISLASASQIVNPVKDRYWIFKTPQPNLPVNQIQVDYLKAKGFKKVGALGVNNAFGKDSRDGLALAAKEGGIEIVADEVFQPGDKDFTAQLTKIKGLNPDALVVHATPGEGAPLTVQARDLGFKVIVHNHGIGNADFINLAKDAANGVLFPIGKLLTAEALADSDPQKKVLLQYIKDYTEYTKGNPRNTFGGHAWDAMMLSIQALEKVGPDAAKIRDHIEGMKGFVAITGVFNFSANDHNGIFKESMVMVKIENGKWVYVAPADYAKH
jgi:branched-chain amino acid transport system substrate-binding protein